MANLKLLHKGKTWNARKTPEGATEFHVGWVNYLDENDEWQEIDANFREENGEFVMDKAGITVKAPLLSDGTAEFIVTEKFHVSSKKKINEADMPLTIKALGVAQVQGVIETGDLGWGECNYIVYPQAYPTLDADLIYFVHHGRAERLRKLVRFNSAITQDENISFEIGYNETDIDVKNWDETLPDKIKYKKWNKKKIKTNRGLSYRKGSTNRGSTTKSLRIWDSTADTLVADTFNGNLWQRIDSDIEYISTGLLKLTKIVPVGFFTPEKVYPIFVDTTTTKYPDQDAESTSFDGKIQRDGDGSLGGTSWTDDYVNWDGSSSGGSNTNDSAASTNILYVGAYSAEYKFLKAFHLFDTSSIGSGDVVDSATLDFYVTATSANTTPTAQRYINIFSSAPASDTGLVVTDVDSTGSTKFASDTTIASISTSAYNTFTLNASGQAAIDVAGITKFGARSGFDIDDIDPSYSSGCGITANYAETAGTSTDPKLTVEHSAGAGGGGGSLASNLNLLGAG